jgi:hypothetical protein
MTSNNGFDVNSWFQQHAEGVLSVTSLADQLAQLRTVNDVLANQRANIDRLRQRNQQSGDNSGSSVLGMIGRFFGGGLGVGAIVSGLVDFFGKNDVPSAPVPLTRYARPLAIHAEAGMSTSAGGGIFAVDSGQGGVVRQVTSGMPAQITVQVQALDSQSFLDRSQDIALAVRRAMLETSVLNDVIREI